MHGTSPTGSAEQATLTGVNAVVWIEPGRALIVRGACWPTADLHGAADPRDTGRDAAGARRGCPLPSARWTGSSCWASDELRTALEREIVAIGHRPETIREADAQRPDGRGGC